jgi:D-tyrosyl-tRNA(Tyr) deacylase
MRALIQRVKKCSVSVEDEEIGRINSGLLIFLGVGEGDGREEVDYLADKIVNLRIFEDDEGKMNHSVLDLEKEIMIVSQFTLYGNCTQGRRPSFFDAASPDQANELYQYFVKRVSQEKVKVATGKFKTMMDVELINDGPVTFHLDTAKF